MVRLSQVNGDVQVQHPGAQGWEAALENMPLQQGDTLATGNGFAEIEFENGVTGYVGDNSALEFTDLGTSNAALVTRLSLTQGSARFIVRVGEGDIFEVRSENAVVAPRDRADFRVDAYDDGLSVSVFRGTVSVATPQAPAGSEPSVVEQGHMLSFHSDNPQAVEITDLPNNDALDAWAAYSNAMIIQGLNNALQYMPQGAPNAYSYGMSDLSAYGEWYNFPGYGWGWQPYGINSTWVPFSNGTWRFAPHFGYCWISSERWGWLPYHFGNWVHAPQGWAWIPGKSPANFGRWQPAVVGWVRVGNQIGWVPRAPGDVPNKLPVNVKYGVVTSPLENTTSVLRGPNNVLRSNEIRSAHVLSEPPNKIGAAPPNRLTPPFTVQVPMNRVPPFSASSPGARPPAGSISSMGARPSFNDGSRAIIYDPATHTYVNGANRTNPLANVPANRNGARLPQAGMPIGGLPAGILPASRMPNSSVRSMPMYRTPPVSSGSRLPIGEPRLMPRPGAPSAPLIPHPMPAPIHPQSTHPQSMPGAANSAVHPGGHPSPAPAAGAHR